MPVLHPAIPDILGSHARLPRQMPGDRIGIGIPLTHLKHQVLSLPRGRESQLLVDLKIFRRHPQAATP